MIARQRISLRKRADFFRVMGEIARIKAQAEIEMTEAEVAEVECDLYGRDPWEKLTHWSWCAARVAAYQQVRAALATVMSADEFAELRQRLDALPTFDARCKLIADASERWGKRDD
jgi:hypothetical protein